MEIAAPVFDSHGAVIGALSILGPEMRLAGIRLENELIPLVCHSAARLSALLGYCRTKEATITNDLSTPKRARKSGKSEPKPFVLCGLKTCF
jgi:hypothetical protein